MATRKLIIAALCCGLAILLAGGMWLVASGGDDGDDATPLLEPGQAATVGDLTVTVLGGAVDGDDLVLTVEGAADGWAVLSPTGPRLAPAPVRDIALDVAPCGDAPSAGEPCYLLFALDRPVATATGYTATFTDDDDIEAWLLA